MKGHTCEGLAARIVRFATENRVIRVAMPAVAFVGGFLWDVLTLGRQAKPTDLMILAAYYAICATILVLRGREARFRGSAYLNLALQFFLGNIFSALVVFYFISAGGYRGLCTVAVLATLLVGNEFLEREYDRLTLSWAIFTISGVMLLNFVLPHLFRSISGWWFYASTVIAIGIAVLLRRLSLRPSRVWPAIVVAAGLMFAHATNLIPPVPLASKQLVIAHSVAKRNGVYTVTMEPRVRLRFWRPSEFHRAPGERVWCFSSIFIPRGLETSIRHRWMHYEKGRGWVTKSLTKFPIRGGRRNGYRGYSYKSVVEPGDWKVVVESEHGDAIGSTRFTVVESPGGARELRGERM